MLRNALFVLAATAVVVGIWMTWKLSYKSGHGQHALANKNLRPEVPQTWWPNKNYRVYRVTEHEVVLSRLWNPDTYGNHAVAAA